MEFKPGKQLARFELHKDNTELFTQCVNSSVFTYFQNILRGSRKYPYPHHGENWKFGGDGEVRGPRNSRGKGGWTIKITFQGVDFKLSMKIATY